jgi:kynureninase
VERRGADVHAQVRRPDHLRILPSPVLVRHAEVGLRGPVFESEFRPR